MTAPFQTRRLFSDPPAIFVGSQSVRANVGCSCPSFGGQVMGREFRLAMVAQCGLNGVGFPPFVYEKD